MIQAQWAATERAAAELYARLEFDVSAIAGQVIAELRERPFLSEDNQALDRWLSPDEQRIAYDQLAALVAEHYFDAAAASRIADSLIASLVEADGIAATEFANQLTTNLRTSDAHFGVQWGPWMSRRRRTGASGENLPALDVVHHDGVGVLTIRRFEDADEPAVSDAIAETLRHLVDAQAIVVDVRQNAGGWPSMVEVVLGSLVGPGPAHILTMYSREDPFESWSRPSMGPSRLWELPVVVVVDGETASAAESLAYALQSLGRARIVGTRTAGAANPGRPFTTATGFSIFIPTASPRDPRTGANWEGGGVIPDHLVEPDVTERAIALARDRCRYIIQKEGRPVHSGISYQCPFGTS
ncbi:MAG: S41 family peptidase [Thermomicrobiales bacterium]